jgi:hypothetical protein
MDDTRSTPVPDDHVRAVPDSRRPYKTPTLTEYGSVAKLTQNMAAGSRADGGGQRMYGTCL